MTLLHGLAAIAAALSLKSLGIGNEEEQAAIDAEIAKFPGVFGLRAFPGRIFMINRGDSYWDSGMLYGKPDHAPGPLLYTHIYDEKSGDWGAFAKGTPEELRRNIVRLPDSTIQRTRTRFQ